MACASVITLGPLEPGNPGQRWLWADGRPLVGGAMRAAERLNEAPAEISPAASDVDVGRVLFAISFANKQIGALHEGLSH